MITHSTNLHLHQQTRHRGPARAKRVRLQSALVRNCMPRLTDLSMDPRTVGVLHDLKDSVISLVRIETPFKDAKQRWLFLYTKYSKEAGTETTSF